MWNCMYVRICPMVGRFVQVKASAEPQSQAAALAYAGT